VTGPKGVDSASLAARSDSASLARGGTARFDASEVAVQQFVPGFFVQAVVAALKTEGIDLRTLERAVGRELAQADAGLSSLQPSEYLGLLQEASVVARNPALGLLVGQRLTESSLHILGPIIVASTTLRSAISNIEPLQTPMLGGGSWCLSERSTQAFFAPAPTSYTGEGQRIATDLVVALAFFCARRFVGPEHETSFVAHFAREQPAYAASYRRVFDQRVEFGAAQTALAFPRVLLDMPRAGTDPALAATLGRIALDRFKTVPRAEAWTSKLESALRAHAQLAQVDFEKIARHWQISARTLRRRVELEGTRLSDVLNQVRFERARQQLSLHAAPIREIAESLGYSEVSSFQRAFKRWAGVAPGKYRERAAKAPTKDP
jgi:AraC-like DNA-binding protein